MLKLRLTLDVTFDTLDGSEISKKDVEQIHINLKWLASETYAKDWLSQHTRTDVVDFQSHIGNQSA